MTTYLTGADLASFLERQETNALDLIVTRVNALIDEEWTNPIDPVPQWVINIAWNVAVRAGANPTGVTSTTRSWDDVTRTDRWEGGQPPGVYLTDNELAQLNGANQTVLGPPKSISLRIPGITTAPGLPIDEVRPWRR